MKTLLNLSLIIPSSFLFLLAASSLAPVATRKGKLLLAPLTKPCSTSIYSFLPLPAAPRGQGAAVGGAGGGGRGRVGTMVANGLNSLRWGSSGSCRIIMGAIIYYLIVHLVAAKVLAKASSNPICLSGPWRGFLYSSLLEVPCC